MTEFPKMQVSGLVMGDRVMNFMDTFLVWSEKAKIRAEIKFYSDPGKKASLTSKFKGFFGSKDKS